MDPTLKQEIIDAVAQLDPNNPEHWIGTGQPRMDVVEEAVGQPLKRPQVEEATDSFRRPESDDDAADDGEVKPEKRGGEAEVAAERTTAEGKDIQETPPVKISDESYVMFLAPNYVGPNTKDFKKPVATCHGYFGEEIGLAAMHYANQGNVDESNHELGYQFCPVDDWDGDEVPKVEVRKGE